MLVFPAVTVEDSGALAKDGANAPALPADNTNIWTSQLLARGTTPDPALYAPHIITTSGLVEGVPYRQPPPLNPDTPPVPRATITRDASGGVTINPNAPAVNDATQTPTAINQIDGSRAPASTTAVVQGRPVLRSAADALPKLTRNEIIALVLLAALVIL